MALDINELNEAIYDKLNVSAITSLLGTKPDSNPALGHYKVPQGSTYPQVCYWIPTGSNDDTFTEWRDEILLQIDIFSDAGWPKEAGDIAEKIADQMDEASLTMANWSCFFCQRQGPPRLLYESETEIYHMVMEYRLKVEKSKS